MSTITLHNNVHEIDAKNANLSYSKFDDVRLAASTFSGVSLPDSKFERVDLDGCSFEEVSLVNVKISKGRYDGMTIDGIAVQELLDAYRAARRGATNP